jgi:hypothetical protein
MPRTLAFCRHLLDCRVKPTAVRFGFRHVQKDAVKSEFLVEWQREDSNTSRLDIPKFVIAGLDPRLSGSDSGMCEGMR